MTTITHSTTTMTAVPAGSGPATPSVLELAYRVQLELEERFAGFMTSGARGSR